MNTKYSNWTKAQAAHSDTPRPGAVLQRKCACGTHTIAGGECDECGKQSAMNVQRMGTGPAAGEVPPIVYDVLRSSGQPLDASTRAFMESRFQQDFSRAPVRTVARASAPGGLRVGAADDRLEREADQVAARVNAAPATDAAPAPARYDFSGVRVHTDARAAESARAINALAYTVGSDVVFAEGQYAPWTSAGRQVLAHELTHTLQQSGAAAGPLVQRMTPCPASLSDTAPVPAGWKPYFGNSCVFHCCYRGILEDRIPTPSDPQNECFYDTRGGLVTENHPYAGCRGTPNQYNSSTDPLKHLFIDKGGIVRSGFGAFMFSRVHEQKPATCLARCSPTALGARELCMQQCMYAE